MRILVVEDDALLGDGIQVGLQQQHFVIDWVRTGTAAESALATEACQGRRESVPPGRSNCVPVQLSQRAPRGPLAFSEN